MRRPPFPIWTMLLPVAVSLMLWAITGSMLVLAFAALGPVGILAQRWDARRAARVQAGEAGQADFETIEAARWQQLAADRRVQSWHGVITARDIVLLRAEHLRGSPHELVLGDIDGLPLTAPAQLVLGVHGQSLALAAFVRAIHLQQRHAGVPETVHLLDGERHIPRCDATVEIESFSSAIFRHGRAEPRWFHPHLLGQYELAEEPPAAAQESEPRGMLEAVIGRDQSGSPVTIDLTAAPHAVVAGASGSGKTELLRRWLFELCVAHSASELNLVLIDFKGGSGFTAFESLPQVLAVSTDLDDAVAGRALTLVQAVLVERERVLRELGARDIAQLANGMMPRLLVFIDEYQLLGERLPEIQAVVADIAARGRSLGIHLVLSTQHPSRAIRDQILANCGLRVALRLHDRAESHLLLGSDRAATLAGRGQVICLDDRGVRECTVTPVGDGEMQALATELHQLDAATLSSVFRPLPGGREATHDEGAANVLALVDDREHATVHAIELSQFRHLVVTGPARSGRSTALARVAQLAGQAGEHVLWCAGEVPDCWSVLESANRALEPICLIIDNIDDVAAQLDPEYRSEMLRIIRSCASGRGNRLAVSSRGPTPFDDLCDASITLIGRNGLARIGNRPAQLLWAESAPVQHPLPEPWTLIRPTIVVTRRPEAVTSELRNRGAAACHVRSRSEFDEVFGELRSPSGLQPVAPTAFVASVEIWLALSAQLDEVNGLCDWVFVDGRLADLRTLLRPVRLPPVLADGEAWLARDIEVIRRRWE
ncbi:MAG: FtsK/SpoIIIE domain-containing protein [Microbacteriaceae bacterium]